MQSGACSTFRSPIRSLVSLQNETIMVGNQVLSGLDLASQEKTAARSAQSEWLQSMLAHLLGSVLTEEDSTKVQRRQSFGEPSPRRACPGIPMMWLEQIAGAHW